MVIALRSMYDSVKSCLRLYSEYSPFFESKMGVKQGDPCSPMIFMMFVNDLIENINHDIDDIFTYREFSLFLLLYADDQVVFAKSAESLQSMLNDIENYCNIWGLKINTSKTKVMIFEKGRHTQKDFFHI